MSQNKIFKRIVSFVLTLAMVLSGMNIISIKAAITQEQIYGTSNTVHTKGTHVDAVAPTCISTGNVEYWECSDDGCSAKLNYDGQEFDPTVAIDSDNHKGAAKWIHEIMNINGEDVSVHIKKYVNCCNAYELDDNNNKIYHKNAVNKVSTIAEWIDDYSKAKFTFECAYDNCGFVYNEDEEWIEDSAVVRDERTCTQAGEVEYVVSTKVDLSKADLKPVESAPRSSSENIKTYTYTANVMRDALQHDLVKTEAKTETCTQNGNIEYWTCNRCELKFSDENATESVSDVEIVIPAHHNLTHLDAKSPTCVESGNIDSYQCSDCDKYFIDCDAVMEIPRNSVIKEAAHDYSPVVSYKAATCTAKGNYAYSTCYNCGGFFKYSEPTGEPAIYEPVEQEALIIPELGHSYTNATSDWGSGAGAISHLKSEATCTESKVYYQSCSRCGVNGTETFTDGSANGHNFGSPAMYTPASCTSDGIESYKKCMTCNGCFAGDADIYSTDCNFEYIIPATGHDFTDDSIQDKSHPVYENPETSCSQGKAYYRKCKNCSLYSDDPSIKTYEKHYEEKLYHDYDVSFAWNYDKTECTATFTCQRTGCKEVHKLVCKKGDKNYSIIPNVGADGKPKCEEAGARVSAKFTPSEEELPDVHPDEKGTPYTAMDYDSTLIAGHDYYSKYLYGDAAPVFDWSNDGTEVNVGFVCSRDKCEEAIYIDNEYIGTTLSFTNDVYVRAELSSEVNNEPDCLNTGDKDCTVTVKLFRLNEDNEEVVIKTYEDTKNVVLPSLGHTFEEHKAVDATCTKPGNIKYYSCSSCNEKFESNEDAASNDFLADADIIIPAKGHAYKLVFDDGAGNTSNDFEWAQSASGQDVVANATFICSHDNSHIEKREVSVTSEIVTEPTCQQKGKKKYTGVVTFGGSTYTKEYYVDIDKCGHNFETYTSNNDATCTEDGTETATCTTAGCSVTDTRRAIDSKLGHNYDTNFIVDEEPSCTASGSKSKHCTRDNCTAKGDITPINPLGHNCSFEVTTEATCTRDGVKTFTCDRAGCNYTYTEVIPKHGHSLGAYVSNNDATCTEDGTKTATCTVANCDYSETKRDVDSKLGHTCSYEATIPATCTEDGEKVFTCDREGCDYSYSEVYPKLGHEYADTYSVDVDATCTKAGTKSKHCIRDNCTASIDAKAIDPLGHDCSSEVTTPATCTEDGVRTFACNRDDCDYSYTEVIPKLGHNYGDYIIDKAATCTSTGTKSKHCTRKGCRIRTEVKTIPATGHAFNTYVSNNDATCTEDGTLTATCANELCGETDTKIDENTKLGHNYISEVTTEATCMAEGVKTFTCENCHDTYTEAIPMLEHVFATSYRIDKKETCTEAGSKSKHCTVRGCTAKTDIQVIEATGHVFEEYVSNNDATCTTDGTKTASCANGCGATDTQVDEGTAGHDYEEEITKQATCTEDGEKTFTCTAEDCEDTYTEVIPKTGHVYAKDFTVDSEATCTKAGVKSKHCTINGCTAKSEVTIIEAKGHAFNNYVSDNNATATADGTKTAVCSNGCGQKHTIIDANTALGAPVTTTAPTVVDQNGYDIPREDQSKLSGNAIDELNLPILVAKGKGGNKLISLSWSKISGATGYECYWSYCDGNQTYKAFSKTTSSKATHKKLSNKRRYKYFVAAYKKIDGKKIYIAKSPVLHVAMKADKQTNAKAIKLNKSSVSLSIGKSFAVKAKATLENKRKSAVAHTSAFRYYSSNKTVATVSPSGKISGTGAGTATIYVVANNGLTKTINVTVK